jgi:hypothetical protein
MKARNFQLRICAAISLLILGLNHGWADNGAGTDPATLPDTGVKQLRPQRVPQPETEVKRLFPESFPISLRGWVSGGYTFNGSTPGSHFNGPYNEVDRDRPVLNQFYFIAEKKLGDKEGINFGGRFDVLFGNDFFLAQSNGLERHQNASPKWNEQLHGFALPQMYAEIGNSKFSIKAGHFYTIIGYEGVPAPSNFFYSKSYSYQFAGPFTHWGGLATANLTPQLTFQAGVVNGWDALDRQQDKPSLISGIKYATADKFFTGSLAVVTGQEPTIIPGVFGNRTRYSALITLRPMEKLEYTFHQHFSSQENGKANGNSAIWYGVDQYLYYSLHKTVKAGVRFEWLRDQAGTRVSGSPFRGNPNQGGFAGDFYSITGGVNYTPHPNITFRPEVRYDWFSGNGRPFNDGNSNDQILVGINAYVQY